MPSVSNLHEEDESVTVRLTVGAQGPQRDVRRSQGQIRRHDVWARERAATATEQKSGDANSQMMRLPCCSSKNMIKPDQYDMEPGHFSIGMSSIDREMGTSVACYAEEGRHLEKGRHLSHSGGVQAATGDQKCGQPRSVRASLGVHDKQAQEPGDLKNLSSSRSSHTGTLTFLVRTP